MRWLFLSYAREDAAFADRLARDLKLEEVSVWIDTQQTNVGDSFPRELESALQQHDYFVPVLSPAYFQSQWCNQELRSAMVRNVQEGIALLPVLYQECRIPALLADKIYADFRDNYDAGLAALTAALRRSRQVAPSESRAEDLIAGAFVTASGSYVSFDGRQFRPWMPARPVAANEGPSDNDLSIEFDLTNCGHLDLRIATIGIEVHRCEPIPAVQTISKLLGLGTPRWFWGRFRSSLGVYPCHLLTMNEPAKQQGCYVKLTGREMELFKLKVTTEDEGVYDLSVVVEYSVAGKSKLMRAGNVEGCVFQNWAQYLETSEMHTRGALLPKRAPAR